MASPFPQGPRIVILTGPGLSHESGFAPFAAATMPPRVTLENVVTREGFARNPERVFAFYNQRRRELQTAAPNAAHDGLAALELARPSELLIVTRNIDDLHERAGSRAVIHTHGELLKARCTICTKVSDWFDDLGAGDRCPVCGGDGHLRPHIVWVGEEPLRMDTVFIAVASCETFVSVGDAGASEPLRSLLADAKRAGARRIEFATGQTPLSKEFDESRHGLLAETVPDWVKQMIASG